MLELYHSVSSVCAQKVRVALAEKGLEYRSHLMTLRGDQFDAKYMKLNPNGVVPTLVHDGLPVIESSVILYYLDEVFPSPPLMPRDPLQRAKVRIEAGGGWLAGPDFSLADIAAVPYVLRLELLRMARLWDARPGVAAWYKRVLARPSVNKEILDAMTPEDHAPFRNLHEQPDPWPKVAAMLS